MEQLRESKNFESPADTKQASEIGVATLTSPDEKDDEEDDEEEEEDKIVEKSYNNRFHKRNKRLPTQISGVDNTFIAIEPKSGKEVMWNERMLPEKKTERDNRFLIIAKKLKKQAHPFLIRFLDAWITKSDTGSRKLIFVNERLDDGTLKQFLCNSTSRSKLIWRRHVGQLLSVLIYLHRLGISHGNLKKEDIYYQSSGILKVGPFMLDAFFGQKTPPSDIYAFGVLALEIAVWTPAIDTQTNTEEERIKLMLLHLTDPHQRSFVESCLDPNPTSRPKIKALLNHPAVTEVPSLKLLSAKVLVASMKTQPPEEPMPAGAVPGTVIAEGVASVIAKNETPTDFAELLEDYISHLEEDTVIMDVIFPTDQVTKARAWKDFRPSFAFAAKYLEDVKNGFYLFLGYRFGGFVPDQEEEDEGSGSVPMDSSTTQPLLTSVSSGLISNVASTSASRKHSNSVLSTVETPPTRHLSATLESVESQVVPATVSQFNDLAFTTAVAAAVATATSLLDSSHINPNKPLGQTVGILNKITPVGKIFDGETRRHSLPNSFADCTLSTNQLKQHVRSMLNGASTAAIQPKDSTPMTNNTPSELAHPPYGLLQQTATNARERRVRQQSACLIPLDESGNSAIRKPPTFQGPLIHASSPQNVPHTPHASIVSTLTQGAAVSLASAIGTIASRPANIVAGKGAENAVAEDDISDEDLSDDGQTNSDDDDDDDDGGSGGKGATVGGERCFIGAPQVVHVAPPTQAPNTPALFTHCQYAYVGAGRWQVYVQMWFVEERLKREVRI